ncbi:MAG: hypothetical protein H0W68_05795 [Gemmatimonadaceae bacterium]|nr:hypothetical protein [Geodermatophilaceae bacterium]MBA3671520.1 hypothetical protein [Gemmatimonadaceae bacterium]
MHGHGMMDRLKDKAKEKAEQRAEQKADEAIDKALDKVECTIGDKECVAKAKKEGKSVQTMDAEGKPVPEKSAPAASAARPDDVEREIIERRRGGHRSAGGRMDQLRLRPGREGHLRRGFLEGSRRQLPTALLARER